MPYPVPPPPPPVVHVSQSESTAVAATARPAAPVAFAAERYSDIPETPAPSTEAAQLGGTIERQASEPSMQARVTTQPAIDALRQAQLPELEPAPSDEILTNPSPPPTELRPAPEAVPSTEDSPGATLEITPEPSQPEADLPEGDLPEVRQSEADQPTQPETASPEATPSPATPAAPTAETIETITDPSGTGGIIELRADYQEYDNLRQVFTGIGNVEMRFRGALLNANRVQVNLVNRIAVAEGNVRLQRGDQVLRGDRFNYNFVQTEGTVLSARGEVFIPAAGTDFSANPTLPTDTSAGVNPAETAIYSPGGFNIGFGNSGGSLTGGAVNRIRFEAEQLNFTADGWVATNIRLTNDPFSPPELEVRANTATFRRLSPDRSELRATNPRVVFDQGFSLPLLRNRIIFDNRQREAVPIRFGFDERERGGLFVEGIFEPIVTPAVQLQLRPQIFLQQGLFDSESTFSPENLGLIAQLDARLSPTTTLEGNLALTSLDFGNLEDEVRASLRARQLLGRYRLSLEYSYRDRLFNGSLGYQTVHSSLGFVLTSPNFTLGNTGINYSYQVGAQAVTADTDREELLDPVSTRENNRASLGRVQGAIAANRYFTLWQGVPLPATPTEGLRYTPNPVVPYLLLVPSVRGVFGFYSNGESQSTLTGSLGLYGQFGHFSRPFLDYTSFNVTYSQSIISGESPFYFDRNVDERVLSAGFLQQIYGPFRFGIQASINLDRGEGFDTDYTLEYSRRTYSILLRFNPEREIGSIGLRINEFNFGTDTVPFSGEGNTVTGGVLRSND